MAITSPGIGSGLDVNGIVSQLMAIERQPLNRYNAKEASYQSSISAYGTVKGTLSSLQTALSSLTRASTFTGSYKTSSSDSAVASATATSGAVAGNYSITVSQLAQAQKLRSATAYSGINAAIGGGKLTIQFGTTTPDPTDLDPLNPTLPASFVVNADRGATSITIDPDKSSLLDVRDAINNAKAGISASIVNDGTGYRLAISSTDSGAANSLKITVEDADGNPTDASGLSALAFDPEGTRNLKISQNSRDALVNIDGIPVVKPSNTITDAVDGVSITLLKESGTSVIGVSLDRSGISTAIQNFAKAYNETNKVLKELTGYDPETRQAGVLQGDATARSIQSQLRSVMSGTLGLSAGGFTNFSQIGISFDRDGAMTVDQTKLNAAINDPNKDVGTVFTGIAKVTDSRITVLSSTGKPRPGRYDVVLTQLATQGFNQSSLLGKTVSTGVNDSFSANIDGITAAITLSAGTYTGASLAAEIQTRLNGVDALKTAGASVSVNYKNISTMTGFSAAAIPSLAAGSFDATLDGVTRTINVKSGAEYENSSALLTADLQVQLNAAFGVSDITVSEDGNLISIHTNGSNPPISVDGSPTSQNLFGAVQTTATGVESLVITSARLGSSSKVSTINSALLSAITSKVGLDVAGSIGGVVATGNGQELLGEGLTKGIRLKIPDGALGNRGTVTYETGMAERINDLLTSFTAGTGTLSSKSKGLQESIKLIDARREEFGRRLTQIEARYRRQFTSLDTLMSNMTAMQASLQQQLTALSANTR